MVKKLAAIPDIPNRIIARAALAICLTLLATWILVQVHQALVILLTAIILSTALLPLVVRLERLGVPRWAGVLIIYIVLLILLTVGVFIGGQTLWEDIQALFDSVPRFYARGRSIMIESEHFFVKRLGLSLPADFTLAGAPPAPAEGEGGQTATVLTTFSLYIRTFVNAITFIIITFALAGYWTLYGERNLRSLLIIFPADRRDDVRDLIAQIEEKLGRFVIGQLTLMLSIGIASFIAYWIIGLPNKLALAIVAGLMEAIPVIGPTLGTIPAVAIGFSISPLHAVWAVVAGLVIQTLENNVLVPRIMGRTVGVNPLVTLLAFVAFTSLFGFIGAVISIPLAAIVQILLNRYVLQPNDEEQLRLDGRDVNSRLRYQTQEVIQDIRQQLRQEQAPEFEDSDEQHLEDSLEALAVDLDRILAGDKA